MIKNIIPAEHKDVADKWAYEGIKSGYPFCCIEHFILARLNIQPWHTQETHPIDGRRMCFRCAVALQKRWPNRVNRETSAVPPAVGSGQ